MRFRRSRCADEPSSSAPGAAPEAGRLRAEAVMGVVLVSPVARTRSSIADQRAEVESGAPVSIAITADQRALADAITSWAGRARPVQAIRPGDGADPEFWRPAWAQFAGLGVLGSALPE